MLGSMRETATGMNVTEKEMVPIGQVQGRVSPSALAVRSSDVRSVEFSDYRDRLGNVDLLIVTRALVSFSLIIFSICVYDFWTPMTDDRDNSYLVLHVLMSVFSALAVILYLFQVYTEGMILKSFKLIAPEESVFAGRGVWPFVVCILSLVHPIYSAGDTKISDLKEWVWVASLSSHTPFRRFFNEYLQMVQICVHGVILFALLFRMCDWGGSDGQRISRLFRIRDLDALSFRRAFNKSPIANTLFSMFYFGVILTLVLRIVESGFMRDTDRSGFGSDAEFQLEMQRRGTFHLYSNAFWFVLSTMATAGFGDVVAVSGTGRFISLLICVAGYLSFGVMIFACTRFLELDNREESAYLRTCALEQTQETQRLAAKCVVGFFRAVLASRSADYTNFESEFGDMKVDLRRFKELRFRFRQEFRLNFHVTSQQYLHKIHTEITQIAIHSRHSINHKY